MTNEEKTRVHSTDPLKTEDANLPLVYKRRKTSKEQISKKLPEVDATRWVVAVTVDLEKITFKLRW